MGLEAASAAGWVVYACIGLNMFREANAVDHRGRVGEVGGSLSDSVLAEGRAGRSVSEKSGLSVRDGVAEGEADMGSLLSSRWAMFRCGVGGGAGAIGATAVTSRVTVIRCCTVEPGGG